ncbi:MAG: DEAD/DEAH box helicase [Candidatus Aenigmarchaeota archaeon]|nr:DEAD/DEAH box helicase [Candidatus Aenigmarchaeota archaeon]
MERFIEHPLIKPNTLKPRLYQETIATTAIKKNCLVVLPTGMGKTLVGIMVAAHRLYEKPNSKVLMIAPTRPLSAQHQKTFQHYLNIDPKEIILITGKVRPEDRKVLYERARVVVSTPQCIQNDIENKILHLAPYNLLIVDETHRSVKRYSYTFVADYYIKQSSNPLILGLTASPGGIRDKIEEVKKNLHIEAVEIRTEKDEDVKPYIQEMKIERVYVELPEELQRVRRYLEKAYKKRLEWLISSKLIFSIKTMKRELLELQKEIGKMYEQTRDFMVARALTTCAQAIKIEHAMELLETQGITPLYKYFLDLEKSKKSYATRNLLNDSDVINAIKETKELFIKGVEHPKQEKLIEIIKEEIRKKPNTKIITFANYRSSVEKIVKMLQSNGIEAREFIGQTIKGGKGLKQKEQIEILNEFRYELFNVLVSTSIGEEGLDVVATDVAIFYDEVSSEIRLIQRRGRVGRQVPGRVIFLITKGTRDESYYWSAVHRERRMKRILYDMKERGLENKTLMDWIK